MFVRRGTDLVFADALRATKHQGTSSNPVLQHISSVYAAPPQPLRLRLHRRIVAEKGLAAALLYKRVGAVFFPSAELASWNVRPLMPLMYHMRRKLVFSNWYKHIHESTAPPLSDPRQALSIYQAI